MSSGKVPHEKSKPDAFLKMVVVYILCYDKNLCYLIQCSSF